jgi:phage terminase large subunit
MPITSDSKKQIFKLSDVILPVYRKAFNWKGKYYFCKGGRGSGKSKHEFLRAVLGVMMYPDVNILVMRKTAATLEGSCIQDVKWACRRLGVTHLWKHTVAPPRSIYVPTGQVIRYRGLDDPEKVKSIAVETGFLCWNIWEEISEVKDFNAFLDVVNSIRGIPDDYDGTAFEQIRGIFNPTNVFWLKEFAFDRCDPDHESYDPEFAKTCMVLTTTVEDNPFVSEDYKQSLRDLKFLSPKRYGPHYLGDWGELGDLIYENYEVSNFDIMDIRKAYPKGELINGLDFGYTVPTALIQCYFDQKTRQVWIYDEVYESEMTIEQLADKMIQKNIKYSRIIADSEDPRAITELYGYGFRKILPAVKGQHSVINGIQYMQEWKIIIHLKCQNTIKEIMKYVWQVDKETGKPIDKPIDKDDHAMNAMMYAGEWMRNLTSVRPQKERILANQYTFKARDVMEETRERWHQY